MNIRTGLTALALALVYNAPLKAQTYLAPPEFKAVDENGVELLSGSATFSVKLGSIGSGDGELSYSDFIGASGNLNSLTNYLAFSYDEKKSKWTGSPSFENSSKSFWQYDNGPWTILRYSGEQLTTQSDGVTLVHSLRDGETRVYGIPAGATSLDHLLLLTRTLPNGINFFYEWEINNGFARPTQVINSIGYKISLEYNNSSTPSYGDLNNLENWFFANSVKFYNLAYSVNPLSVASRLSTSGTTQLTTDGGQIWKISGNPMVQFPGTGSTFSIQTPSSGVMNRIYTPVYPLNSTLSTTASINGSVFTYNFSYSAGTSGGTGITTITSPSGRTTEIRYNRYQSPMSSAAFPYQIKDGNGNITSYTVINGYQVTSVTHPLGGIDQYSYDSRGNITSVTHKANLGNSLPDIVESAIYSSSCPNNYTCNKPTSVTDKNGNITQYTYAPEHGGILTETLPAVGGISPVKRYHYAQRYAWILDGSGGYMHAGGPVWLRTEERTCRSTATVNDACAGGSSDEVVTSYDYGPDSGPNNLLLRSTVVTSGSQSIRTCYSYDNKGNKISETKPLGAAGGCP